jgi:acyl carrier protein
MTENVRETILNLIATLLEEDGLPVPPIVDDSVLLETGLDSLGFAVLVTQLESVLGYDPFTIMSEAVYPRTLSEFVSIYVEYAPD